MIDIKTCEWLIENADAPIRYRVARELLKDKKATKKMEGELIENKIVQQWLNNLKPNNPPQRSYIEMVHGSADDCLETAMAKTVRLGLHADLPQVQDAAVYYTDVY